MQETQNVKIVQDAYAAFGRGDIDALLSYLADDVEWQGVYGAAPEVPTSGVRHGKAAVREFFSQVAATSSFTQFEPRQFVATGDTVVTLGHYAMTVNPTGRPFESDFAMVFTVRDGRVTRFHEFCNSAALNAAFAAVAVPA